MGGVFSGKNYSRIDNPAHEIDLLPSIAQNFGWGLMVGHREEAYAMEVSFWESSHTASFGPVTIGSITGATTSFDGTAQDRADYYSVNVDFKRYFLTESQFQPFVNLGVSFPWIIVQHAAEDANNDIGDLTLAGLGLNLGVGAEYYLTPNFSVMGAAYQRWASFDQFKGWGNQFYPLAQYQGGSDDGSGLMFEVGTTVGFQ